MLDRVLDTLLQDDDGTEYSPNLNLADERLEEIVCDQIILSDLRQKLTAWRPWANDLLDYFILGEIRTCTSALAKKYGVSPQAVRKYKRQFEDFIKNFLADVSF